MALLPGGTALAGQARIDDTVALFGHRLTLDASKEVRSVTLAGNPRFAVYPVTLAP